MNPIKVFLLLLPILFSRLIFLEAKSNSAESEEAERDTSSESSKFVKDPYVLLRWPGMQEAYGNRRYPWFPTPWLLAKDTEKDKSEEDLEDEAQQQDLQDDEEEDDEPEDDFDYHNEHTKHLEKLIHSKWKKQKPTAVSSVGFGPAVGKATWYGVLRPAVNSRSAITDLDLEEEDDNIDEGFPTPVDYFEPHPPIHRLVHYVPYAYQPRYGLVGF